MIVMLRRLNSILLYHLTQLQKVQNHVYFALGYSHGYPLVNGIRHSRTGVALPVYRTWGVNPTYNEEFSISQNGCESHKSMLNGTVYLQTVDQ